MKKILSILGVVAVLGSCTSQDTKTTEASKSSIETGVQNSNGGIPDTTNAINLSHHKQDSTGKRVDSSK